MTDGDRGRESVKAVSSTGTAQSEPRRLGIVQARLLQLHAQGLLQPLRRRPRSADLIAAIERMRLLQIDTIHVVARSPYLVLHSRLGDYPMEWLDAALAAGQLAEVWAHEASLVPACDVGLHRGWRPQRVHHWAHRNAERIHREERAGMDTLLAGIRKSGPMRAIDYARAEDAKGKSSPGWWEWKPEKRWLEAWFALGELMVSRRERFQRVYALTEHVLPGLDPPLDPEHATFSIASIRQRFIADSVRALGVTIAAWIADYYRLTPAVTDHELQPLLASGELTAVAVAGWARTGYVHRDHAEALEKASLGRLRATHTTLLSPFDPLVWDRARASAMFNFDYTLECYTPAAKRRFGYFVLPILHRGRLIGRLDAKAHRADGVFEVKAMFLEPGVAQDDGVIDAIALAITKTALWHGTPEAKITATESAGLTRALRTAIHAAR